MKASAIYLKAAEDIFLDKWDHVDGICWCVANIEERYDHKLHNAALNSHPAAQALHIFSPNKNSGGWWGELWGDTAKECRVIALCFMAAIEESK